VSGPLTAPLTAAGHDLINKLTRAVNNRGSRVADLQIGGKMTRRRFDGPASVLVRCCCCCVRGIAASQVDPQLFSAMKWRQVGPFRGGRVGR